MKKLKINHAVNRQEDEDGYTHYPDNAPSPENKKRGQGEGILTNTKPGTARPQFDNYTLSFPGMPASDTKRSNFNNDNFY